MNPRLLLLLAIVPNLPSFPQQSRHLSPLVDLAKAEPAGKRQSLDGGTLFMSADSGRGRYSHRDVPPKQREERMGIRENLVRLLTGIEAVEDIVADLGQPIERA